MGSFPRHPVIVSDNDWGVENHLQNGWYIEVPLPFSGDRIPTNWAWWSFPVALCIRPKFRESLRSGRAGLASRRTWSNGRSRRQKWFWIKQHHTNKHILEQYQKTTNLIEVTRHCDIFFGGAVKNYPYVVEEFWTRRWESCQTWDDQRLLHQKLGIQTKMQNIFWLVGTAKSEYLKISESLVQMYPTSWFVCLPLLCFPEK